MRAQSAPVLKHVGIVAIDGVFASTLMQAKDFFHMASLRHGKQQGLGLQPAFRTRILSPDGQPVRSFSGDSIAVDGPLAACDIVVLPAFWGDFDALERRYPQIVPWLRRSHAGEPPSAARRPGSSGWPRQACWMARKRPPTGASIGNSPNASRTCCSTRRST